MLDALLGRKFTAKCKHAIKCIYERLKPIRNRKQAVVNILRKDIADLLRSGNDALAFGRMDELMTEMNRLACYDMIQKFCECVMAQLLSLQKHRDCPPEDMESVSTLIFAAARFSDLPELCDLRHVFTMRYGSMETFVNPEFKDKVASKVFPVARKLQLMKDIASELSVTWDSESFEYKVTNPSASESDKPKKRTALKDPKALPVSEKAQVLKHVATQAKDIHVISCEPEPTIKTKKEWADDEPEDVKPARVDSSIPQVKPAKVKYANLAEDWQIKNETYRMSSRAQVLDPIHQDGKLVEQLKPKDDYRDGTKVSRLNPNGEEGDSMGQPKLRGESRASHVVTPVQRVSNGIDAKESHDIAYKRSSRAKVEERQAVREQQIKVNDTPKKVPQYAKPKYTDVISSDSQGEDGVVHERSTKAREDTDLTVEEGRLAQPHKPNNDRAFRMIPPPYVKTAVSKVGANSEQAKPSSQPTQEGMFAASDKPSCQPTHDGAFATSDKSNNGGYKDLSKDEFVDDGRFKPRSVRRKQPKPPVVQEVDSIVYGDEPVPRIPPGQRRRSSRRNNTSTQDGYDEEEKIMDKLLMHYSRKEAPDQSSKHRVRTQAPAADDALHKYGEAGGFQMNGNYRIHKLEAVQVAPAGHTINSTGPAREHQTYGRHRIPKAESVQAPPADHVVQDGEAVLHQTYGRYRIHRPGSVHPPERAVSLPPDPVTPKEMVKGPARATSMQPESPTTPGERTYPRLPDYDDLTARFAALKRG